MDLEKEKMECHEEGNEMIDSIPKIEQVTDCKVDNSSSIPEENQQELSCEVEVYYHSSMQDFTSAIAMNYQNRVSSLVTEMLKYSEFATEFIRKTMELDCTTVLRVEIIRLETLLKFLLKNPSICSTAYTSVIKKNLGKGILCMGDIYLQLCGDEEMGYELIVADIERKKMTVLYAGSMGDGLMEMDFLGLAENGVIDLNSTGRYWEGGVLNGECCSPCGYGKEYNDDNNVVYEGFMFGGKRVSYGKEYRGIRDINKNKNVGKEDGLVYEGGYLNGVRYGYGKLYDLNGNIEYEGKWVDNKPIKDGEIILTDEGGLFIPLSTQELVFEEYSFDEEEITNIHFSPILLSHLKRIEIGRDCFQNVREFVLDEMEKLESVKIGLDCFRISEEEGSDGLFRVTNCPNLHELAIDHNSFQDYKRFELSGVDSLQLIQFGGGCFEFAESCILKGRSKEWISHVLDLPTLEEVSFSNWSFRYCPFVQLESMG